MTGTPVKFDKPTRRKPDTASIDAVLKACPVRDDVRVLVKFAFGMSTPRLTELKLGRHPLFGSLDWADYSELLAIFQAECDKVGGENVDVGQPVTVPAKSKSTASKRKAPTTGGYFGGNSSYKKRRT